MGEKQSDVKMEGLRAAHVRWDLSQNIVGNMEYDKKRVDLT